MEEGETIQLDVADSARPFEPCESKVRTALEQTPPAVQRWEEGKWLAFPVPTKTDQSGPFNTMSSLASRVVTAFACWTPPPV